MKRLYPLLLLLLSLNCQAQDNRLYFERLNAEDGTGLGLSLSYDIVVKGHGGKIDLNSAEGQGATFTITLPAENRS